MRFLYSATSRYIALSAVALVAVVAGYLYWSWNRALDPGPDVFVVKPGTTLKGFARQLAERGVLVDRHTFVWLAYATGRSRSLKAGEYRFRKGITPSELLEQVAAGRVVEYPFVLIEGWNFRQVLDALRKTPKLAFTLNGLGDKEIMARLGHPGMHPEGRFYPDTYYYSNGMSDLILLTRAFDRMDQRLNEEWENRASDLPLKSMEEALTLASIVEKETGKAEERPLIAGVFVNRLRKGMKLQSDPTVIYGIGPKFDGNIRTRDLRRDTPYNTYTRRGLPPTPIAMPSGAAINAVMHPQDTRALFFVSRNDGSHVFSESLDAHNSAVIKYQLNGRGPKKNTGGPTSNRAAPASPPAKP